MPQPAPARLRHELERQLLAVEPRAAARPASTGSSATRRRSARCARARPDDGRGAARRHRRRPGNQYTLQQLQDMVFANRQHAGELWRDELADFCEAAPGGRWSGSNGPVDVSEACPVLRDWDLHDNLDSDGAILFRRFATRALGAVPVVGTPGLYTTPFNASDARAHAERPQHREPGGGAVARGRRRRPATTPASRSTRRSTRGCRRLAVRAARIAEDPDPRRARRRRRLQRDQRRLDRLGRQPRLHQRPARLELRDGGAASPDDACPNDTRTILTYSQSTDPASPWFKDQTRDVLEQGVGGRGVLRERDPGRPEPRGDGDRRALRLRAAQGQRRRSTSGSCRRSRSARQRTPATAHRSRCPRATRRSRARTT